MICTRGHSRLIQTIEHEGGTFFVLGYMTSRGMGCMCKIKGMMTQDAMYLSILQDEVMKTIE